MNHFQLPPSAQTRCFDLICPATRADETKTERARFANTDERFRARWSFEEWRRSMGEYSHLDRHQRRI